MYMQNCVACICLSYLKLVNHLCSYLKMTTSGVEINLIQCLWELYKFDFIFINSKYNLKVWRRQLHPTPGLLPGKSHEWRSLEGCSPWGHWGWTWLRDFTFTFHFHALEKEMATHSSVIAWRIPGTAELGRLPSMGSHSVGHDWSDLAAAVAEVMYSMSHFDHFKWTCYL